VTIDAASRIVIQQREHDRHRGDDQNEALGAAHLAIGLPVNRRGVVGEGLAHGVKVGLLRTTRASRGLRAPESDSSTSVDVGAHSRLIVASFGRHAGNLTSPPAGR